jgi:hypothetical protein
VVGLILLSGFKSSTVEESNTINNAEVMQQVKDIIWEKEEAIYKARESGNLYVYIGFSSEKYMGWPPGWLVPSNLDKLKIAAPKVMGMDKERLVMTYKDLALSNDGNTAIIYYSTHRTSDPQGVAVDQHFDVSHVWVKENSEWKLFGSMGRITPEPISL